LQDAELTVRIRGDPLSMVLLTGLCRTREDGGVPAFEAVPAAGH
jgi:hypothetical protein